MDRLEEIEARAAQLPQMHFEVDEVNGGENFVMAFPSQLNAKFYAGPERRSAQEALTHTSADLVYLIGEVRRLRGVVDAAVRYADEQAGPFGGTGLIKVAANIAAKIRELAAFR